jgi:hypothetical protein
VLRNEGFHKRLCIAYTEFVLLNHISIKFLRLSYVQFAIECVLYFDELGLQV